MKILSFLIRNAALPPLPAERRTEVYDATAIRNRLNRSMRRRLSDDLESLARRACLLGHLDTAEELLAALRNLLGLESRRFPRDRRIVEGIIEALAAEIAAAKERKAAA